MKEPFIAKAIEESVERALAKAEQFELLSAYLDDEVTEQERCLVEHWLSSDSQLQQQYQAQLKIRSAMKGVFKDSIKEQTEEHVETAQTEAEQTETDQTETDRTDEIVQTETHGLNLSQAAEPLLDAPTELDLEQLDQSNQLDELDQLIEPKPQPSERSTLFSLPKTSHPSKASNLLKSSSLSEDCPKTASSPTALAEDESPVDFAFSALGSRRVVGS